MDSHATYAAHTGRWLVTLVIGLVVLATAYYRAPAPAWFWGLPLTDVALASAGPGNFGQVFTTDNQLFLSDSASAAGRHPAGAWRPVALWLTAGGSPGGLAAPLPNGWPLATNQADGRSAGRPQGALATRRLADAEPLREE